MNALDAVVVGGGFSGLAAARVLHRAGKTFALLEARNRLGGRVYTERFADGKYLDLGGQWIGSTQNRMYALCHEYGLSWYDTYNKGINILDLKKRWRTYSGLIPKMDALSLLNIDWMLKKLQRLANEVEPQAPWETRKASSWDSETLHAFVKKHCYTDACYRVVRAGLETVYACELNEISLLHALFYIRSGTSLNTLLSIENGAQQHRVKGGMQSLADRMAEPFISSIRLNQAVTSIEQSEKDVVVSGNGFSCRARKVIVAIPPAVISRICFEPALHLKKRQLLQKLSVGIVGKVFGVYDRPFWRDKQFSGQVVADEHAPFQTIFDASPEAGEYGVLLAFCIAGRARQFFSLPEKERENLALQTFTRYFGKPAATPLFYRDHCWADEEWSQGCYATLYPTGAWTAYRNELAQPVQHIYWAGTETASRWYGYIEGAVIAGERAADEVMNSLS